MTPSTTFCRLFLAGFVSLFGLQAFAQWQQIYAPKPLDLYVHPYENTYLNLNNDGLYRTANQGATWELLSTDITNASQFAINPYNQKWYRFADNGVFESVDEGATWTDLNAPTYVQNIQFSLDTVFVQTNTQIQKNAGGAWQTIFQSSSENLSGFCVKDSVLFCSLYSAGVYRSGSYGQSWQKIFEYNFEYSKVTVRGDTVVCFFPLSNRVYRSVNFGQEWEFAIIPDNIQFSDIIIQNNLYWGVSGTPTQPYYSSDGLHDWQPLPLPVSIDGGNYVFQNHEFLLLSTNFGLFRSLDLGQHWEPSDNAEGPLTGTASYFSFLDGNILLNCLSYLKEGDNVWKTPYPKICRGDLVHWNDLYLAGQTTSHASIGLGQWVETQSSLLFRPNIINGILSCESGGYVQQSYDDGATWQATIIKSPTFDHLPIVGLGNTLWAAGANSDVAVFKYDTMGQNWPHDALWTIGHNRSFLLFRDTIYLATQSGPVQYSPDGGHSIVTASQPADFVSSGATVNKLHVKDLTMVLATEQNKFYVSNDRGQSWAKLPDPPASAGFYGNEATVGDHLIYTSTDLGVFTYPLDSIRLNKGTVFLDQNGNGIRNGEEPGVPNIKIKNTGSGQIVFSDSQGTFGLTGNLLSDSLRIEDLPEGFSVNPASLAFQGNDLVHDFALQAIVNITDVSVGLIPSAPFRPGFETTLTGVVRNQGTPPASGTLAITLPSTIELLGFLPAGAVQTDSTLVWTFDNLTPFAHFNVEIIVKTNVTTQIGTTVYVTGEASNTDEQTPVDNMAALNELVVGSFDPNDKLVTPVQATPDQLNGQPLTYTIRFQNTGNFPTDFVIVRDTISPLLDLSTLNVTASSHPVEVKYRENRLVEFIFSPLALAPQSESETESQGFVRFEIRAREGLEVGQVIENQARIYFDYNLPIVTNLVGTELKTIGVKTPETVFPIVIAPNPADRSAMLTAGDGDGKPGEVFVYDLQGRQLQAFSTSGNQAIVPCEHLTAGTYLIRWVKGEKTYAGKLSVAH